MATTYTLPMLLVEWENLGSTEPFPMEAADILLRVINSKASDADLCVAGACFCGACLGVATTSMKLPRLPPRRYKRKKFF